MRHLLIAALAVATAVPALAARAPADDKPRDCLNQRFITDQRIVDDHTIYYRVGSRWYHNDLGARCGILRRDAATSTRTPSTQLCRGDIITSFDPVSRIEYGSCGLGDFVPSAPPPPLPPRGR